MKTLGILVALLIVAVIILQIRGRSSQYTLPTGSMSLMSLHEFSTMPSDMKDLYNEHVASHLFPILINLFMKFLEQRYQGGKEQFKKDFVTFVNRIDDESKKIDFTMQSTREPMMTKETDKISGYTSYQ